MRLLVELEASKSFEYDLKYFHKLQGFVYKLLRETPYKSLHDKGGYKFFCFSNIFPIPIDYKIKKGEEKRVLISSP
ncbi:MAG: CRISPR-associated endoribonuclease Cas6, partial [Candidatus Aenigmatarchaeota archaeon]